MYRLFCTEHMLNMSYRVVLLFLSTIASDISFWLSTARWCHRRPTFLFTFHEKYWGMSSYHSHMSRSFLLFCLPHTVTVVPLFVLLLHGNHYSHHDTKYFTFRDAQIIARLKDFFQQCVLEEVQNIWAPTTLDLRSVVYKVHQMKF